MEEFGEESVEFVNAYASAPSSILSGAAMFTGMPSCFVSRHFDFWQFDPNVIISLQNVLSSNGYTNYAVHNSKEDREVMKDLIHPVSRKYFPKGVSHGQWWTNRQVNAVLRKILDLGVETPAFFMLWYDCRNDADTSEVVKQGLQLFKENGLYDESVIVMCSDHGYPDPRTGLNKSILRRTRHDMVVTDDNIRIPLFIKYPGCRPKKVNDVVGTVDLFPTLLHLLNVKCDDPRMINVKGHNLIDLLEGSPTSCHDRMIRIDTRLRLAPGRVTALRRNKHKYVYYHDEKREALYDLENDPDEIEDIMSDSTPDIGIVTLNFRKALESSQNELNAFHIDELRSAFKKNIKKVRIKNAGTILLLTTAPNIFLELIAGSFRETFEASHIDILLPNEDSLNEKVRSLFNECLQINNFKKEELVRKKGGKGNFRYDLSLIVTENSSLGFDDPRIYRLAKNVGKKVLMVDYNMTFYNRLFNLWTRPLRRYWLNRCFYREEPALIVKDIVYYAKTIMSFLFRKALVDTPDMEKVKMMRDRALVAQSESESSR